MKVVVKPGGGGDGDPLLEEIKGLRQDIQATNTGSI